MSFQDQTSGPVVVDLQGLEINSAEAQMLTHPLVGGVILFARNCESVAQVSALTQAIRKINPELIIAIDQEGGRVQRIKEPLTLLPPMAALGRFYGRDASAAIKLSQDLGWLMAAEIISLGIDISFAPVLDLDYGVNPAIGNRAFHAEPLVVTELTRAFIEGMNAAGMAATGKHFPGHGAVYEDSHVAIPKDLRSLGDIENADLIPFKQLATSHLAGVMPAHIIFPAVDELPAGFSAKWIQDILRQQLGFTGVVFSDDLSMEAAGVVGGILQKAEHAWSAGCDALLVCNHPESAQELLSNWKPALRTDWQSMQKLRATQSHQWGELMSDSRRDKIRAELENLHLVE